MSSIEEAHPDSMPLSDIRAAAGRILSRKEFLAWLTDLAANGQKNPSGADVVQFVTERLDIDDESWDHAMGQTDHSKESA